MAAGQGFKTFTTGEVLTAADVNGYLMQGVGVFTDAANRDAEITSPQEGQFAYLKDTNVTTYYTGSAWANLDTTGMTNPMTTTGDTIYSSSGSTPARLPIGTTGQILTVAGGVPTWASATASGQNWTLVNTGGTAMSGSSGITISGITGADKLMICILQASGNGNNQVGIRINNDSTSNRYNHMGLQMNPTAAYDRAIWEIFSNSNGSDSNKITVGKFSSAAASQMTATVFINGGNSSGVKAFQIQTGVKNSAQSNAQIVVSGGWYEEASTISSIRVICDDDTVNFDAGTLYVFKSA